MMEYATTKHGEQVYVRDLIEHLAKAPRNAVFSSPDEWGAFSQGIAFGIEDVLYALFDADTAKEIERLGIKSRVDSVE